MTNKTTDDLRRKALEIYRNIASCLNYPLKRKQPALLNWLSEDVLRGISEDYTRAEKMMSEIEKIEKENE